MALRWERAILIDIVIDKSAPTPLQEQLCRQIRGGIVSAALPPGSRMPTSRDLARDLGVSRNTVTLAYERLIGEGYLHTRPASGTFVARGLPRDDDSAAVAAESAAPRPGPVQRQFDRRRPFDAAGPVADEVPAALDFWLGLADPEVFPLKDWRRHVLSSIDHHGGRFGYPPPTAGVPRLRRAIANWLGENRGLDVGADEVLIVSGSQQAFNIVARLFLAPGERVAVEAPCHPDADPVFRATGAELVPVPVDERGLRTEFLPQGPLALAYVTPSHQHPVGGTLPIERRRRLIDWARHAGAYILEDDIGSHFRYEGVAPPTLKGMDPYGLVIHCGTFSLTLGAGLRLGYMVMPPELIPAARAIKGLLDKGSPWLEQVALSNLIESGGYSRHIAKLRRVCREKRDLLIGALISRFGDVDLVGTDAGVHFGWLLPANAPPAALIRQKALALGVGLHQPPATAINAAADGRFTERALYLGYGTLKHDQIVEAVDRLAAVIASCGGGPLPDDWTISGEGEPG